MFRPPKSFMNNENKKIKEMISQKLDTNITTDVLPGIIKEKVDLKKKINLKIKYFVEDHKSIDIESLNGDYLSDVIDNFLKDKKFEKYFLKGIYYVDIIKEKKIIKLDKKEKIYELGIIDNSKLLLILKKIYSFDKKNSTEGFEFLKNNSKVILKKEKLKDGLIFEIVSLDFEINKNGRYFWQIEINNIILPENLLIGIANPDINKNQNPFDSGKFWGIQPLMYF